MAVARLEPPEMDRSDAESLAPYQGLVARLFGRPLQKTLATALADGLRYLKAEAERRPSR